MGRIGQFTKRMNKYRIRGYPVTGYILGILLLMGFFGGMWLVEAPVEVYNGIPFPFNIILVIISIGVWGSIFVGMLYYMWKYKRK